MPNRLTDKRNARATSRRSSSRFGAGMATAHDDDVKLFHVEHSFSEAEASEEGIEHRLGRIAPYYLGECAVGNADILGIKE